MKCYMEEKFLESICVRGSGSGWYESARIFWTFTVWDMVRGLMNIVSTVRQEEVIIVMCGGGTEVGCWLGLERKLVWAEEEREKIRKNRWNQLQNSLRKWNSKKLRAVVQHCGFLSKYDSPCARREKIAGLQRTRVQFLVKNDVPMKVILRNTLSGEGELQMPKCRDYWSEGRGELNGWLPFSSFFNPPQTSALRPMWTRELWSTHRTAQQVANGCSESFSLLGAGWCEGKPSSSFPLISGVEDIRTVSCGYIEKGEVREKNSFDFLKSFIFPPLWFFFFFKENS